MAFQDWWRVQNEPYVLRTALTPEQCAERLRQRSGGWWPFGTPANGMRGRVSPTGFSLGRGRWYQSSPPIRAIGQFHRHADGTDIAVRPDPPKLLWILVGIWFGLLAIVAVALLVVVSIMLLSGSGANQFVVAMAIGGASMLLGVLLGIISV